MCRRCADGFVGRGEDVLRKSPFCAARKKQRRRVVVRPKNAGTQLESFLRPGDWPSDDLACAYAADVVAQARTRSGTAN